MRCGRCRCEGHRRNSKDCPHFIGPPINLSLIAARKQAHHYKKKCKKLKIAGKNLKNLFNKQLQQFRKDSGNILAITENDEDRKKCLLQSDPDRLKKLESSSKRIKLPPKVQMQHQANLDFISSLNSPKVTAPKKALRHSSSRSRSRTTSSSSDSGSISSGSSIVTIKELKMVF